MNKKAFVEKFRSKKNFLILFCLVVCQKYLKRDSSLWGRKKSLKQMSSLNELDGSLNFERN
jgi:hypothetical protein